jgi:hypothetical protein
MAPRTPKFGTILGSLAVHIALMALMSACSRYYDWYHQDDVHWSSFRVEPLRLHLAEPIYLNAKALDESRAAGTGAAAGNPPGAASTRPAIPNGLQLPSALASHKDAPVVFQPDTLPDAPQPLTQLPALAFWARQAPDIAKPRSREAVIPGRAEAPSPAARPAAPPVLAVPNREAVIADVNIAIQQTQLQALPALPVPNTATIPVRLRNVTEPQAASFEALPGEPVNIIAMASRRDNGRILEIPRGLRNLPVSTAGEGGGQPGERSRLPSEELGASGSAAASTQSTAPAQSGGPTRSSAPTQAAKGTELLPPTTRPLLSAVNAPGVVRIQHPANGNFDVVVMQSAAREDLPGAASMLTGSPVYTIYLNVGEQKEWLMEYCVPGRDNKQASPYQINVDDAGSITPPYPISTVIPEGIRAWQAVKHIVLSGLLTAGGSLQITGPSNAGNSSMNQLVALVSQWVFRPALRNNKAIDLEFVLVIPPQA